MVQNEDLENVHQPLANAWLTFPTLSKYSYPILRPRYLEQKPWNPVSDNRTPECKPAGTAREMVSLTADNLHQPKEMRILYRNHRAYAWQQR